jgi:Lipopolysaccharide-assembly
LGTWAAGVCMLAGVMAGAGGCGKAGGGFLGYRHEPLYPTNVRTVAVEIFENRSFYQGAEFDLTEALAKEIELRTPYKVVDRSSADTLITGTISSIKQGVLSRTTTGGVPQEMQVTVNVAFEWKDMRSGQVLRARSAINGTGQYVPTEGLSESYSTAQHEAMAELAQQIVSVMQQDW